MATVKTYANQLWQRATPVAYRYGVDLEHSAKELRVLLRITCLMVAVVLRLLFDKGLVTDQEIIAAFDTAGGDTYPEEPDRP